jgi:selenocysteine lyase/cysteine desulfurase
VAAAFGALADWDHDLSARFLEGVRSLPRLRVYGITDPGRLAERTPTFAVRLGERHPYETAKALGARGIYVWDGHYYALELMERLGLQETGGAVRIGFCHYNTLAEVDRVLEELSALA